ncbi:MAG: histidinol-phosphatase HisJ family protein [Lachnospiraceae bacterium]|nr:histidinol-phosphatase HisJ family protein [Lachnospiraceae bacterium]
MHTSFSGDCQVDPILQIRRGKELGLGGVTITDHLDLDYKEEPGLFDLDFPSYIEEISKLQKEESDESFQVGLGLELGLQEHLKEEHHNLLKKYPFDYVIGSIHVVNGVDPYYAPYFQDRSPVEAYTEYLEACLRNVNQFHEFDSFGHLDYIARYGSHFYKDVPKKLDLKTYGGLVDAILEALIRYDIALEVNTAGFRHGLGNPNPSFEIITRYKELGGQLLTLGADAHRTEEVGLHFENMAALLRECGFDSYAVFRNRKPEIHPLVS